MEVKPAGGAPVEVKSAGGVPVEVKSAGGAPVEVKSAGGAPVEAKSAGGAPVEVKLSGVGLFGGSVLSVERFAVAQGQGLGQGLGQRAQQGLGTLVRSRTKPDNNHNNSNGYNSKKKAVITKYPLAKCREITRQVDNPTISN